MAEAEIDLPSKPPLEEDIEDEPIFKIGNSCNYFFCSDHTRQETLEILKLKNVKAIGCRVYKGMPAYSALTPEAVSTTFRLCDHFDLSEATRYLALEIFDRFIMRHVYELHKTMKHKYRTQKVCAEQWHKVTMRVSRQCLLRMLTCIQLASKITDRNKVLTTPRVRYYLKMNNFNYTAKSIVASETRVCNTLHYELEVLTRFVALESLLGLRRDSRLIETSAQVFSFSIELLQLLYLRHSLIFTQLARHCEMDRQDTNTRQVLWRLQSEVDCLWAGAAIIVSSLYFVDISLQEIAIEELVLDLTDVRSEHELRAFAWVLTRTYQAETREQ